MEKETTKKVSLVFFQMLIILVDMFVSARPFPMANHWIGQAYSYGCSYMTVIGICIIGGNDIQVNCHYVPPLSKLLLKYFLESYFALMALVSCPNLNLSMGPWYGMLLLWKR